MFEMFKFVISFQFLLPSLVLVWNFRSLFTYLLVVIFNTYLVDDVTILEMNLIYFEDGPTFLLSNLQLPSFRITRSGGSHGLLVMGRDSLTQGRGFESWHRILEGHDIFFTLISCKNCIVCWKRPKINEKEAGDGPFKKLPEHLYPTSGSLRFALVVYNADVQSRV